MFFAVNAGNTNTSFAVFRGMRMLASWKIKTPDLAENGHRAGLLKKHFSAAGLKPGEIDRAAVCSVIPELEKTLEGICARISGAPPAVVRSGADVGMPMKVKNPHELGADRAVNAFAARELYGNPVAALDFGTAITVDLVNRRGEYEGGLIAPGFGTSCRALFENTSMLPFVKVTGPGPVIGRNTAECIRTGVFNVTIGGLKSALDSMKKCSGLRGLKVVLTGGAAGPAKPAFGRGAVYEPFLTVKGLALMHGRKA